MLVFNQKFVSGSRKIKSTIEGLAFDRPCWAIMPDLLRTLLYSMLMDVMKTNAHKSSINLMIMMTIDLQYARTLNVHLVGGLIPNETSIVL